MVMNNDMIGNLRDNMIRLVFVGNANEGEAGEAGNGYTGPLRRRPRRWERLCNRGGVVNYGTELLLMDGHKLIVLSLICISDV